MTTFKTRDNRWLAPLRCLVVALACATIAWAGAGAGPGGPSAQSGATTDDSSNTASGGGDETIGTLPFSGGVRLEIVRHARLDGACLAIEGRYFDIASALRQLRGSSRARLQILDGERVRVTFVGDVRIGLDRQIFQRAGLLVGIARPDGSFAALPQVESLRGSVGGVRFRREAYSETVVFERRR
ncbi:MAG: hypothetical protein RL112_1097 [Planctomycetota bacterium]|jgi:hypothetical protein